MLIQDDYVCCFRNLESAMPETLVHFFPVVKLKRDYELKYT